MPFASAPHPCKTGLWGFVLKECLKKGIRKVHICPNNKENISAIYTILNTGGYLLEEFIDDERIIERYEIILVSYSITMHILTKGR